jgi:hypothetical protein
MPVLDGERRLANLVGALTEDGEARAAHAYPETARVTPLSFDAPAQPTRETVSGIRYDQLDTGHTRCSRGRDTRPVGTAPSRWSSWSGSTAALAPKSASTTYRSTPRPASRYRRWRSWARRCQTAVFVRTSPMPRCCGGSRRWGLRRSFYVDDGEPDADGSLVVVLDTGTPARLRCRVRLRRGRRDVAFSRLVSASLSPCSVRARRSRRSSPLRVRPLSAPRLGPFRRRPVSPRSSTASAESPARVRACAGSRPVVPGGMPRSWNRCSLEE